MYKPIIFQNSLKMHDSLLRNKLNKMKIKLLGLTEYICTDIRIYINGAFIRISVFSTNINS